MVGVILFLTVYMTGQETKLETGDTESVEAIIQAQLNAYNATDLDRFLAFFSEDAQVIYFPSGEFAAKGIKDLREVYGKWFGELAALESFRCELLDTVTMDDLVVAKELLTGLPYTERFHFIAIYQFKEKKVHRLWLIAEKNPR